MVVDDEQSVIKFMSRLLTDEGYVAVPFINAEEAFEFFINNQHQIDLIVTDLVMPNIDGLKLIEKIRRYDQQIPVLLMSGDFGSLQQIEDESLGIRKMVEKPMALFKISDILQEVLEQ